MSEESNNYNELAKRIKSIEIALVIFFGIVFGLTFLYDLCLQSVIPKFYKLFNEMLEGEPLPLITSTICDHHMALFLIDIVLLVIMIALIIKRKIHILVPFSSVAIVLLLIKIAFTNTGLFLPLIHLLDKLGG